MFSTLKTEPGKLQIPNTYTCQHKAIVFLNVSEFILCVQLYFLGMSVLFQVNQNCCQVYLLKAHTTKVFVLGK